MNNKTALGVFARAPIPGEVKTRLHPILGEQETCDFYKLLIVNTLKVVSNSGVDSIQLWCSPVIQDKYFQSLKNNFDLEFLLQEGKDLGERMLHAVTSILHTHNYAILIGCDCPDLNKDDIELAINKLENGHDVVLGPTEDGGYYLIGMSNAYSELFTSINWGSSEVLKRTRELIIKLKLSAAELDEKWDIDRPEDYERYLNSVR